ncbi:MAG: hypothetical protein PVH64_03975 [Bacillota bacterium]
MFSADDLGNLQKLLSQLGFGNDGAQSDEGNKQDKHNRDNKNKQDKQHNKDKGNKQDKQSNKNDDSFGGTKKNCPRLDPTQILVIGGLLSGALVVRSVWVNNDQTVQFILTGNLKRKTQLDKMMEIIGQLPFDEVVKAMVDSSAIAP